MLLDDIQVQPYDTTKMQCSFVWSSRAAFMSSRASFVTMKWHRKWKWFLQMCIIFLMHTICDSYASTRTTYHIQDTCSYKRLRLQAKTFLHNKQLVSVIQVARAITIFVSCNIKLVAMWRLVRIQHCWTCSSSTLMYLCISGHIQSASIAQCNLSSGSSNALTPGTITLLCSW